MIADDEKTIRALVTKCLGDYVVIEAEDGAQALDLVQLCKPDLLILDIMMPRMDGYTVCQRLKMDILTKGIPIVMLTSLGSELNAKLSQNLGADAYITKPFSAKELTDTVDHLLG